jgi:hypothetical protein
LIDKISALPQRHFLREFVQGCGWRLVGVDNVFEPARSISSLRLQQAVIDTVEANNGRRYQWPTAAQPKSAPVKTESAASDPLSSLVASHIQSVNVSRNAQNKRIVTIVYELPDSISKD